mmetsp:Transcript_102001/g.181174  ORF Transcript_102001/g.181174 Transcript_102001/m.181174 type:complete len:136 (+) Transcript_102001:246-653(+)
MPPFSAEGWEDLVVSESHWANKADGHETPGLTKILKTETRLKTCVLMLQSWPSFRPFREKHTEDLEANFKQAQAPVIGSCHPTPRAEQKVSLEAYLLPDLSLHLRQAALARPDYESCPSSRGFLLATTDCPSCLG